MKRAYSLVELLVVVAIIALLAALLFPALASAKYEATLTTDITALSQIGHAYALYESDNGGYPHTVFDIAGKGIPDAMLSSRHDRFPKGEASMLRGDLSRRISFLSVDDYMAADPSDERRSRYVNPLRWQQLPGGGPLVLLLSPPISATMTPGVRDRPGRYLRLTFAGGVVSRTSRRHPSGPSDRAIPPGQWLDSVDDRFYDRPEGEAPSRFLPGEGG